MKKDSTAKKAKQAAKAAEIKAFRHQVAVLKKKGLIDKKYDARSVKPTKYLKSVVKELGNVLTGEAQPVKVSKAKAAYYKEQGYTVRHGKVVVPVHASEKVYGTHGDFRVKATGKGGSIIRLDLGLPRKDITKWKEALIKKSVRLAENERLTFQLFGHNSFMSFRNTELMVMYLENYQSFNEAEQSDDPDKHAQYISNVVIYRVERGALPEEPPEVEERAIARRARQAEARQKWIDRQTPEEHKRYKKKRAEQAKKHRDNLTPEQRKEYKRKAKERAAKSNVRLGKSSGKKNSND